MHQHAPTLTSDRLILRAHEPGDFEPCYKLWNEPTLIRHFGGKGSSQNAVWNRMLRYAGLWGMLGYGYWAVTDRETGEFLGDAGLANFERDITPSLGQMPETGWALISKAQGQGRATEAMQTILAWADQSLDQDTTCCIIDPVNRPSIRVAEKLGYAPHGPARLNGTELQIYRRPRQNAA